MSKLLRKGLRTLEKAFTEEPSAPRVLVDEDGEWEDAAEAHLHPDAHDEGGIACRDEKLLEAQRSAVMEVIKMLGRNLLTGNLDLLKVSLPVRLNEPRSYLQKLADPWAFPRFLRLAAEQPDPVQRMKLVMTYFIAGLHRAFLRFQKPFNPILGETWQGELGDGSRIFIEQISHHPPISAFQLFGPSGLYEFRGLSQPDITYKTNAVKTTAKGYRWLLFADGGAIEIRYPAYYLKGLLYSTYPRAEITGCAEFIDKASGLYASVQFGRVEDSSSGSLLGRPDGLQGTLFREELPAGSSSAGDGRQSPLLASKGKPASSGGLSGMVSKGLSLRPSRSAATIAPADAVVRTPLATCSGNYLSHLDWGKERYWTLLEEGVEEWQAVAAPLPSDCRHREDLALLAAGELAYSQRAKEVLENVQRRDKKLREALGGH